MPKILDTNQTTRMERNVARNNQSQREEKKWKLNPLNKPWTNDKFNTAHEKKG